MIYLQMGILILEIGLCYLINNVLKDTLNKKNTIRHLYRITIKLLEYAYVSSYVGYTYLILFTCIINRIQEKKTNHLHTSFSYHIHIHRYFWLCEYVHDSSNKLQSNNRKEHNSNQDLFSFGCSLFQRE